MNSTIIGVFFIGIKAAADYLSASQKNLLLFDLHQMQT